MQATNPSKDISDYMKLETGDYQSTSARTFSADRDAVFGHVTKKSCATSTIIGKVRQACKEGTVDFSSVL